ncbi:MAG: glycosyltransferase [Deinococcales bacterium]
MTWFITLLYALEIPYIALMLMVIVGMFRVHKRPHSDKTPSVSVVIPAHNEEVDLPRTLESLAQQRYEGELEFIIVNDRSKDATESIIQQAASQDSRFKLVNVLEPSKRFAPKVNAVNTGIHEAKGEIILASDSDCLYPETWIKGMVSHFEDDVAMVVGYVETDFRKHNLVERFEATDWFSLMLVSRSLTHFGWKFASSANNQGYRRSAFDAIGGFGSSGRAPSGDEDLFTQRMGKLPNMRVVFASSPDTQVKTSPMSSLGAFLNQRRRWVSRYHHSMHYHPAFLASIACLGFQSIMLSLGILLSLFIPKLAPWILGIWALKLGIELVGMFLGTRQFKRPDLWGPLGLNSLAWAIIHPFFIGYIIIRSFMRSGEWKAGARSYRKRFYQRKVREFKRKVKHAYETLL